MHAGGAIRTIHVLAAAILVAGLALAAWRPALARRAEWAFWAAATLVVLTGVGNLATLGGAAAGTWATRFAVKLALILALLLASGARVLVLTLDDGPRATRLAYSLTATLATTILALGVHLAHA